MKKNQKVYCLQYVMDYLGGLLGGGFTFTDAERKGIASFINILEDMIESEKLPF